MEQYNGHIQRALIIIIMSTREKKKNVMLRSLVSIWSSVLHTIRENVILNNIHTHGERPMSKNVMLKWSQIPSRSSIFILLLAIN